MNAIFTFVSIALAIIGVWALLHVINGSTGSLDRSASSPNRPPWGTILVLVVYLLANLALPFYYRKYRPMEFHPVKHAALPALGVLAIIVPLYYLAKPGQPTAYDWFPYAALIIVAVAAVCAFVLNSRDGSLTGRVGAIVADE